MRPAQARFVTLCQQFLALGAVLAVLTPAASVLTLDIVAVRPDAEHSAAPGRLPSSQLAAQARPARVPTAPVDPVVREVSLTPPAGVQRRSLASSQRPLPDRRTEILARPVPVEGYGAIGVTWSRDDQIPEGDIRVRVRTREAGRWSAWLDVAYDPDHAPDPESREGRHARPGTDALLVGDVDDVQVKAIAAAGEVPADLKLAVIDPGASATSASQAPAIDTGQDDAPVASGPAPGGTTSAADDSAAIALRAAVFTPKPRIFSRAQWGADEAMRDKSSLRYFEVHAGFVHHTVNANDYTRDQVPAIIRGIYAYHTRSRGWSDIGYNFLVDRFGRIWEGRYGGVDRPVVGAHTLGYNDYAFAMSAIGNYETAEPSAAVLQAYGRLFAWKLSLHGVSARSTSQQVGPTIFQAINGHRDAASTACPGANLYARLPEIRDLAAAAQQGWSGRQREDNLVGSPNPDLVVRRAADARVFVLPIDVGANRAVGIGRPVSTGLTLPDANALLNVGDWDRDGFGDLVVRGRSTGDLVLYRGDGTGTFTPSITVATGFSGVRLLAAVGDMTGDGKPDLMGQPRDGVMRIFPGRGLRGLKTSYPAYGAVDAGRQIGLGRWDSDGAPDSAFRAKGTLRVLRGNGPGGLTGAPSTLELDLAGYDWTVGIRDARMRGRPDLVLRDKATGSWWISPGTTRGLGAPRPLGAGAGDYDLVG